VGTLDPGPGDLGAAARPGLAWRGEGSAGLAGVGCGAGGTSGSPLQGLGLRAQARPPFSSTGQTNQPTLAQLITPSTPPSKLRLCQVDSLLPLNPIGLARLLDPNRAHLPDRSHQPPRSNLPPLSE